MPPALARALYSLMMRLALPLYFARLWRRGAREPLYRSAWNERLGRLDHDTPTGRVWIHAVSLGETRAASALIDALRPLRPGCSVLLTHGTATGREAGRELLRQGDAQAWLPYDTPGAVRRFLRLHRPVLGVLVETELWPNLLHEARRAGVPMVLANARLSERSRAKGERFAALLHAAAAALTEVLAQTEADAARLRASGATAVRVMGNLKFDLAPPAALLSQGRAWRTALGRGIVLAASTREGEEALLLQAWQALPRPRPLLLMVPRHPQRFDAIAALVAQSALQLRRRTEWEEMPPADALDADVWLGDSMGEMAVYASAADVALLGGSFAPLGGQNLIELAASGSPVVMGPHTFNFSQAAESALDAGAAIRVADLTEGVARAIALTEPAAQRAASARAIAFARAHRGAAARMAQAIARHLPPP